MKTLIKNSIIVSDGEAFQKDVLMEDERIVRMESDIAISHADHWIDASGKYLLPGAIDAQVHFRDPGLTHKGDIYSESKAAAAGGVTSFIDMPNTIPNAVTLDHWKHKYRIAKEKSLINYAFLLGINQSNINDLNVEDVQGMLALTDDGLYFSGKGNLMAQFPEALEQLFIHFPETIIALHCEDERMIEENIEQTKLQYGEDIPFELHGAIRSASACYDASKRCIDLAKKTGGRFHLLHVTSGMEMTLLNNQIPLKQKRITAEVCVQNLLFCDEDYPMLGRKIKWNPSIKTAQDRDQLWEALLDDRIDIITTDHAPHTWEEKLGTYTQSLSGAPMIQHALPVLLDFVHQGKLTIEKVVEKMAHNPAVLYQIQDRGFIREGYYADLVLVDMHQKMTITDENILYKCGWSPLEGRTLNARILQTWVNGHLLFNEGSWNFSRLGLPLQKVGFESVAYSE
ncbi:MAG: hypothetical protein RLY35_174 [Bacteroidota bacterium]|jgi:dihydroorotase